MTALTRIAHKIFGSNAPLDEIGQFGSAVATTKLNTKDVATIQNLPAYEAGWGSAVVSNNNYPALEEMTGAMNVMSYQTGYLFERGIPEWINTATYYTNCFCSLNGKIYVSQTDNNINHDPTSDTTNWKEFKASGYRPTIFDMKWSDHLINDIQWLRSDTFSWQSGSVYVTAYNELVSEYNNASSTIEYNEAVFVQPILSANGVMGGSSFAVDCSSSQSNRAAYKSFDGNSTTKWGVNNTTTGWLTFYNPQKLKVSNIRYTPSTDYPTEDGGNIIISGSDDNSTWEQLWTGTYSANTITNFTVNSSNFYKYHKIEITNGISSRVGLGDLTITATYQTIQYKRTPKGYKIADATQETAILNKYNTDGIAWYYILDTANTRFKLPRTKFGFEGLRTSVGNDIAESLPNIKGEFNAGDTVASGGGIIQWATGLTSRIAVGTGGSRTTGFTLDASRSSSTYQDNAPVQERATQMYLYFYVGEYAQTAIEQTAGLNAELFNNKADKTAVDGQWTTSYLILATQVTAPTTTDIIYDLSSYLPNDNYNYEVFVGGNCKTGTVPGNITRLSLITSIITNGDYLAWATTRSSYYMGSGSSTIIPVGVDRRLTVRALSDNTGDYSLRVHAYRRLGTNS